MIIVHLEGFLLMTNVLLLDKPSRKTGRTVSKEDLQVTGERRRGGLR